MSGPAAPLTVHTVWASWQFPPVVTVGLLFVAAVYLYAAHRVRREHPARPWPRRSTASFLAGLAVVYLAVGSFIGVYDDVLFSVHMAQHLLLIMVAPPLLVWGRPITLVLHAMRNPWHRRVKRALRSRPAALATNPFVGLSAYTAVIVGTHLTGFMNLVLTSPVVHDLEHALYLLVGYLFFLPLLGREPTRWRLAAPARALLLLLAMPVDTFTGVALLTYAHEPFPAYSRVHRMWGPSLIGDLHQGAAVMWIAGDGLMLLLLLTVVIDWAHRGEDLGRYLTTARLVSLTTHAREQDISAIAFRGRRTTADDDVILEAYNKHLRSLAESPVSSSSAPRPDD